MIGIVVVSHSPQLAHAAVDLALQMVSGPQPAIAIAAGAEGGVVGTDAVKVAEAIASVSGPDGVLVMMDLGSAVLSAELAIELMGTTTTEVRLSSGPFVEGLLAAIVRAAGGASLDEVEREARGALAPKREQLAVDEPGAEPAGPTDAPAGPSGRADVELELKIINEVGLHARPASQVAATVAKFTAAVSLTNTRTGKVAASAASPTALQALGARKGDTILLAASGTDAAAVAEAVRALFEDGFGELNDVADAAAPPPTAPAVHTGSPLGVSPGVAYGPVLRMGEPTREPAASAPLPPKARPAAVDRLVAAMTAVTAELEKRASRLRGEAQAIVSATAMMASDPGIRDDASRLVTQEGESPERAVWVTLGAVADQFAEVGGRAAERSSDVADVRGRIVAHIEGRSVPGIPDSTEPFVLVARDLAPADTAELDPALCKAIVTVEGGPTSHTAILARSLGIPAIVGARDAFEIPEGTVILVDGSTGAITRNPSPEAIAAIESTSTAGPTFAGRGQTSDGHFVELLANIGSPDGAGSAVDAGAEGVGLFRTEFCFLERTVAPTIAEQVEQYRAVFAAFPHKKVVVRTLDAGADKPLAFVTADHEDNPALGIRGIRTSWRRGEILDDQLAAIAQAAAAESAHVQVMAPMIATVEEAREFARACSARGIPVAGAMIETPAAALMAASILAEVEFASLGTNDLAQYTMAADRLVGELAELNDPWQPAVLRLVAATCEGGVAAAKPVGVCGEAASDPVLAVVLVGLGVSSLSMTAKAIARVAAQLGAVTHGTCVEAARLALAATSPADARAAVTALLASA